MSSDLVNLSSDGDNGQRRLENRMDEGYTVWFARLSSGVTLHEFGTNAFSELFSIIGDNRVTQQGLHFRKKKVILDIPDNASGLYFGRRLTALLNGPMWRDILMGWVEGDYAHVVAYSVPLLESGGMELRKITEKDRPHILWFSS